MLLVVSSVPVTRKNNLNEGFLRHQVLWTEHRDLQVFLSQELQWKVHQKALDFAPQAFILLSARPAFIRPHILHLPHSIIRITPKQVMI